MDKHVLRLSDVEITKEQLVDLFKVSLSVIDLAMHDLTGSIVNIRDVSEYLSLILERLLKEDSLKNIKSKDMESMMKMVNLLQKITKETVEEFGTFFSPYDRLNIDEHFISRPQLIVESIKQQRQYPEISISNESPDSLEIVFPGNILYGILSELVENAVSSSQNEATVLIQWRVKGNNFQCEVHDNGSGIDPAIGDKFIPLDILESRSKERKMGGGLRIINRILVMAKGLLLFSNSKILGGSLVYFEFPILGYSQR